jgi:hypothetical protein
MPCYASLAFSSRPLLKQLHYTKILLGRQSTKGYQIRYRSAPFTPSVASTSTVAAEAQAKGVWGTALDGADPANDQSPTCALPQPAFRDGSILAYGQVA